MTETTTKPINSDGQRNLIFYIILGVLILSGVILWFKNSFYDQSEIDARILKNEIYLNESLLFSDNTKGSEKWLWEFGNGDKSTAATGNYNYKTPGSYIVRLTVNGEKQIQFPINVRDTIRNIIDSVLTITGPTAGLINEEIRLEGDGNGRSFEWSFGESGRVDVTGKTALYTYRNPGKYMVRLKTDKSKTPVYHQVFITDNSETMIDDLVAPGDGERMIIDDIKSKLQSIASGGDFNSNYYYLINNYLCNNEKVTVKLDINGKNKQVDFYSYCMGLTFGGDMIIDEVQLSIKPNSNCTSLLNIKQHSAAGQLFQQINLDN